MTGNDEKMIAEFKKSDIELIVKRTGESYCILETTVPDDIFFLGTVFEHKSKDLVMAEFHHRLADYYLTAHEKSAGTSIELISAIGCKVKPFNRLASELNGDEKFRFEKRFYKLTPWLKDNTIDNNAPWGCPWKRDKNKILRGKTINEMVSNYIKEHEDEINC